MSLQSQLDEWAVQNGLDPSLIRFIDYSVQGEAMGTTRALSGGAAEIRLHRKLEGHAFASEIVLWHEFCHAWTWQELRTMDHDTEFIERDLKKPFNFILGIIPAAIILLP